MITTGPNLALDSTHHTLRPAVTHLNVSEAVFFFDIDNCLYNPPPEMKEMMRSKNIEYCEAIGMPRDQVIDKAKEYYQKYNLTVRGLKIHYDVDIVDFDEKVDQAVPLETFIKPNTELRSMLLKLKTKKWAFTNAYYPNAIRVLKSLEIDDLFDGIIYCDYAQPNFPCKPEPKAYHKAMLKAQVTHPHHCFFLDDSESNLDEAHKLGWTTILLSDNPSTSTSHRAISKAEELSSLLPDLFKV